jgi:DNA-binding MarR family transcriptional regulator
VPVRFLLMALDPRSEYAHLPEPGTPQLRQAHQAKIRLLAVAERLRQNWTAHAAALGLTNAQANVLLRLRAGEAVPMRSLAGRLDYDASNLTTLIDRLEARGAVERRADPRDRRVKALVLTAEGERLRDDFWRSVTGDPGPLAALAEPDLRSLVRLLDRLEPG